MNDEQEDARSLYQRFREANAEDRDTSNGIERFKNNRVTLQTHQKQIDQIIAALPDNLLHHSDQRATFFDRASHWFTQLSTVPVLKVAVLGLCAIGVIGIYVQQKPDPWTALVPSVVVDAGLPLSGSDSIGGTPQMGFTARGNEFGFHYLLGKTSAQLALSAALQDDSLTPYFAASYKRMASRSSSPVIAMQLDALVALLSKQSDIEMINKSLSELKLSVSQSNTLSLDGFALGQHIESLRLALLIAENQDELRALSETSATIASLRVDKWSSADVPALEALLTRIHNLTQSSLSLRDRRELKRLIQQLNVLLT